MDKLRIVKSSIICLLSLILASCQMADKHSQTFIMGKISDRPTQLILLDAGTYEGDLTIALFQEGFKVKPIASKQTVSELETPTKRIEYKEAECSYAIKLSITHDYGLKCFASRGHNVIVTMSVIDTTTNETLAVVKQSGPDQECPPLTPVWTLLAKELSKTFP